MKPTIVVAVALASFASQACYGRAGFLVPAVLGTAIVTAAVVSASRPPPPRVVYVPESRPGYAWQPGYWTLHDGDWVWVDGQWVALRPGYDWAPAHWEGEPDGTWRLIPGHWVPANEPPPPPPPPPDE